MKTFQLKAGDIKKSWHIIDAKDMVVGRAAAVVSKILRGKHKPEYTPHMDCGDCVVVINAEKICFTGNKENQQHYYWHTGYPGGIKSKNAKTVLQGKYPERVFEKAVERMMGTSGPLKRRRLGNLYVYAGPEHPHAAQNPQPLPLQELSPKNHRTH